MSILCAYYATDCPNCDDPVVKHVVEDNAHYSGCTVAGCACPLTRWHVRRSIASVAAILYTRDCKDTDAGPS